MNNEPYDLIGDIHGHHDKLTALLAKLGYRPTGHGFRHPEGRKVIFLGDYIDRGPKAREVLLTVRAMVESSDALAIMGNHEFNAVLYHTPDGNGGWLRPRRPDRDHGHLVTLAGFEGREAEWTEWLEWMRRLPMFLDLGGLRAVHACWDDDAIKRLHEATLTNDAFVRAASNRGTAEFADVENVLKGPEMTLPHGAVLYDKDGTERTKVRVRWWDLPNTARVGELAMPEPVDVPGDAADENLRKVPDYAPDAPPVFVGHYWLPADRTKAPLRHNVACLDFSAAREGPLVAYRWNGERHLDAANYVTINLN